MSHQSYIFFMLLHFEISVNQRGPRLEDRKSKENCRAPIPRLYCSLARRFAQLARQLARLVQFLPGRSHVINNQYILAQKTGVSILHM